MKEFPTYQFDGPPDFEHQLEIAFGRAAISGTLVSGDLALIDMEFKRPITGLAQSDCSHVAILSRNELASVEWNTLRLWNIESREIEHTTSLFDPDNVDATTEWIRFVPGINLLAVATTPEVLLWDPSTLSINAKLALRPLELPFRVVRGRGKTLLISLLQHEEPKKYRAQLQVRNFVAGTVEFQLSGSAFWVADDGSRTVVLDEKQQNYEIWDIENENRISQIGVDCSMSPKFVFSAGNQFVLQTNLSTLAPNTITIWEAETGKQVSEISNFRASVLKSSPVSDHFVAIRFPSKNIQEEVLFFEIPSGQIVGEAHFHTGLANTSHHFSQDGRWFGSIANEASHSMQCDEYAHHCKPLQNGRVSITDVSPLLHP